MLKRRLIAVLIVRDGQVVQSVRFKHTNVIHYDPVHAIECFNKWAVDEIVLLNVSRTADSRAAFLDVVAKITEECFVPIAAGGWVTDLEYATRLLSSGADKLVVNTILADEPDLFAKLANRFGRQCVVASMDVKREEEGGPAIVQVDRGARSTGIEAKEWARMAEQLGAGEILFNSIDHDGARKGYDLETISQLCEQASIPVIAMGGVLKWDHLLQGIEAGASAVAAANIWHYTEHSTKKAKRFLVNAGIDLRHEPTL